MGVGGAPLMWSAVGSHIFWIDGCRFDGSSSSEMMLASKGLSCVRRASDPEPATGRLFRVCGTTAGTKNRVLVITRSVGNTPVFVFVYVSDGFCFPSSAAHLTR